MPLKPTNRAVGCFVECDGKILLLHRSGHGSHPGTWGLPGGKVDPGETDLAAIIREMYEEIGLRAQPHELELLGDFLFDFPEVELHFPAFRLVLNHLPTLKLDPREHDGYRWITAEAYYAMPKSELIHGSHDLLERAGYIQKNNLDNRL